jgi:molybdate transport system substrate-binding protein
MRANLLTLKRGIHVAMALALAASLAAALPCCRAQAPRQIHVLAATDLQPVMTALADAFEKKAGIKIVASFASSATLATQIVNGDPADLFLAADYNFPETIVAAGLADTSAPVPYATGTLVLWARKDSPFQPLTQNTLHDTRIQSLAIADPDHAPYGLAAQRALIAMKAYDQLKPHLVTAESVSQAAQFVESGNAQLGMISMTSASTPHMKEIGSFIRMQPGIYPAINQCAVVMKNSSHRADAHQFLDWLRSPAVQQTLREYGLDPVK